MTAIRIRLREALKLKSREDAVLEALYGRTLPPRVLVPARTDLLLVELDENGSLALLPDGRRIYVGIETLRRSAYIPRKRGSH